MGFALSAQDSSNKAIGVKQLRELPQTVKLIAPVTIGGSSVCPHLGHHLFDAVVFAMQEIKRGSSESGSTRERSRGGIFPLLSLVEE
jgi:hypothetical protein